MKRFKTIFLRGIFYLMAFQILNLSIDHDHIILNSHSPARIVYDDIDSYAEYVVELIAGDSNYTYEDHKEDGNPQNKGLEKYQFSFWYTEQVTKPSVPPVSLVHLQSFSDLDLNNRVCKGYHNIISPPPKA